MSTTTNTVRYILNCQHGVDAKPGKAIGAQVRCPACSDDAGKTVRPRIAEVLDPSADVTPVMVEETDAAEDRRAAAAARIQQDVDAQESTPVQARAQRLADAKAAAARGEDAAAVLAQPIPGKAKAAKAAAAPEWIVRFRNVSEPRADALRFAGWSATAGTPVVITDRQAAAALTGLLKGALNRVSDQPQPTPKQASLIQQMLRVIDNQLSEA